MQNHFLQQHSWKILVIKKIVYRQLQTNVLEQTDYFLAKIYLTKQNIYMYFDLSKKSNRIQFLVLKIYTVK